MQELKTAVKNATLDLFGVDIEPELSRPDEQFGDYSTNIAMQIAGHLQQNPREIATKLAEAMKDIGIVKRPPEVAEPGFINFTLTDSHLAEAAWTAIDLPKTNDGQEILVEFGDPNPFKEMHIGHLYSYIVGDSISKLLESTGATVRRLSYHGDVGLHVAKTMWGILKELEGANLEKLYSISEVGRTDWLAYRYVQGNMKYEESGHAGNDPQVKLDILAINTMIYQISTPGHKGGESLGLKSISDQEIMVSEVAVKEIYETTRQWSFDYFDLILADLKIHPLKRYLESQSAGTGLELVRQHIGTVFKESDGAIIYEGEKIGLHNRVFITSENFPTYETKDLGLAVLKKQDYPHVARSIIITANEQSEYFKVMLAALSEFDKDLADKTTHLAHGFLSLSSGKMSSRTGDVYTAIKLMVDVQTLVEKLYPTATIDTEMAAIKYGFLKHRLGTDIVYDVEESVSLEGNSGPYLQYAHARACSILAKAKGGEIGESNFDAAERSLARKISEYPEVVAKATQELMPHHIAVYLYELAQNFNRFYEKSRIIGDERQDLRLKLTKTYQTVLSHGLGLLNVTAPEQV